MKAMTALLVAFLAAAGPWAGTLAASQSARDKIAQRVRNIGVFNEVFIVLERPMPNEPAIQGDIRAIDADTFDVLTNRGELRRLAYAEVWKVEPFARKRRVIAWDDLGRAIERRRVTVTLPTGVRLEGDVAGVTPEHLELNVGKTSDPGVIPKGPASIPRGSISKIQVRGGNTTGIIVGASVGGGLAVPLWIGLAISANELGSGATGVEFLVVPAFAFLGAVIGSTAHGEDTVISLVPAGAP